MLMFVLNNDYQCFIVVLKNKSKKGRPKKKKPIGRPKKIQKNKSKGEDQG